MSNTKVTKASDGVIITLEVDAAAALTALLGAVIDCTSSIPSESLYNALADAGFDTEADERGYGVEVEDNAVYDEEDENDVPVFIRLVQDVV